MSLSTATVTFDISDQLGNDFDPRRTKVWITTNVPGDTIVDTTGNQIRLGSGNVTVNADGTGSIVVWVPGTGSNPDSWQTTVHVDYPDRNEARGRGVVSFGPFTITTNTDLADLVEEQAVPPTYLTTVTDLLDGYVDSAAAAATAAAASATSAAASAALAGGDYSDLEDRVAELEENGVGGGVAPARVVTITGTTQEAVVFSDTILTGTLSADAVLTLAFATDDACSVMGFIDMNGHDLTWGGSVIAGSGEVAVSCVFDGVLAHYMPGTSVTSIAPPIYDVDPPTTPANLDTGTITSNTIEFSFTISTSLVGIDHYELSKNGGTTVLTSTSDGTEYIDPAHEVTYTFTGLNPDTDYTLAVRAVDQQGTPSAWATLAASTIPGAANTLPSAPSNLEVTGKTADTISLAWDAATDDTAVTAYRLSKDNGATWVSESIMPGTLTYTVTGLTAGTSYTFVVQAADNAGWGPSSNAVTDSPVAGFTDLADYSWNFDEGTGSSAAATAGGFALARVGGVSWVSGKHDYAVQTKLSALITPDVDTTAWSGLSIMLWTRFVKDSGQYQPGALVAGSGYADGPESGIYIPRYPIFRLDRWSSTNTAAEYDRITARLNLDDSSSHPYILSHTLTASIAPRGYDAGISNYPFDHIGTTWDDATGAWKIYLNGAVVATGTATGTLRTDTAHSPGTLKIIATHDGSSDTISVPDFDMGLRDDLRIFTRALTEAEFVAHMNEPVA